MDLEDRVCIVTGGAMGLGKADAEALQHAGAHVVITDIAEAAGRQTAEELGERVSFFPHDVTQEQQWIDIITSVVGRFGRLDVLVNNAGIVEYTDIEQTSYESWRRVNAVSADGTFFGCKHAVRAMRAYPAEPGNTRSIINMASIVAARGYTDAVAYGAAKGAIRSLTKAVAVHCNVQKLSIRCNALLPGVIDTPMVRSFLAAVVDSLTIGAPSDVANAVVFLASEQSRYINGSEIRIDNAGTQVGTL